MDTPVFRSRWLALAFVMLLAMGAAHLVGDEKSGGLISDTAERIVHQQSQQDGDPRNPWSVEPGKTVVTSNAELLRDTPAFRPIPDDAKGDDVVGLLDALLQVARNGQRRPPHRRDRARSSRRKLCHTPRRARPGTDAMHG